MWRWQRPRTSAVYVIHCTSGRWHRSERKSSVFQIDTSWIAKVEAACKWYDKVIAEFPQSTASRLAYEGKLRTILGWEASSRYDGPAGGVRADFAKYMPQLLTTFSEFETNHADAPALQAFRFQIAQAYWSDSNVKSAGKDWAKAKEWLSLVIQRSGGADSFYKDLAQRRLDKLEQ